MVKHSLFGRHDNATGWNIMACAKSMIFQCSSTLKVSIELPATFRHCHIISERLLKAILNLNKTNKQIILNFTTSTFSKICKHLRTNFRKWNNPIQMHQFCQKLLYVLWLSPHVLHSCKIHWGSRKRSSLQSQKGSEKIMLKWLIFHPWKFTTEDWMCPLAFLHSRSTVQSSLHLLITYKKV